MTATYPQRPEAFYCNMFTQGLSLAQSHHQINAKFNMIIIFYN